MPGGQVLENNRGPEVKESILETWCKTCGTTGPTANITGLTAEAAQKVYEEQLKPWLTDHAKLVDERTSYKTAVGAVLNYHEPQFGPRE